MNTMKTITISLAVALSAATALAQEAGKFKNDQEKISYALGMNFGTSLKQGEVDVDYELLLRGLKDA